MAKVVLYCFVSKQHTMVVLHYYYKLSGFISFGSCNADKMMGTISIIQPAETMILVEDVVDVNSFMKLQKVHY
jgi:hypothetical protein